MKDYGMPYKNGPNPRIYLTFVLLLLMSDKK